MTFKYHDGLLHDYLRDGFLIFRDLIPPTLLADLRKQADIARDIVRNAPPAPPDPHGNPSNERQRIQPLAKYEHQLDLQPFRDYLQLPELVDAIHRLLGPGVTTGQLDVMGLLLEPKAQPWTCGWHRDGVVEVPPAAYPGPVQETLETIWHDLRHFNQINCALYDDSCTWYVPGSHLRSRNLPGEVDSTHDPALHRALAQCPPTLAAHRVMQLGSTFPQAVQIHLRAGDLMIYRNLGWHLGTYQPWARRATIHDVARSPADRAWSDRWSQVKKEAINRLRS